MRTQAALIVLFLISIPLFYTESAQVEWESLIGGPKRDEAWSITETTDHGFIITGVTWSYSENNSQIILIKTDPEGQTKWIQHYGGTHDDFGNHVLETSDHGFLISGTTRNTETGKDAILIKTDSIGTVQWNLTYSTNGFDEAKQSINCDTYYFTIGTTQSNEGENSDILLLNVTLAGEILSIRRLGGQRNEYASSISPLKNGGYVVSGDLQSIENGLNGMVMVLRSNGDIAWSSDYGGFGSEVFTSCIEVESGDFIAFGYDSVSLHSLLVKIGEHDEHLWTRIFSDDYNTWSYGGTLTDSGNYIMVGYSGNKDENGFHVLQPDSNGDILWGLFFGSGTATSVDITFEGDIVVAGTALSGGMGGKDIRVVKISENGELSSSIIIWFMVLLVVFLFTQNR